MWNKSIFNNNLSNIVVHNFKFISEWGKWELKEENRTLNIHIGYNEYYGSSFYVKGISADIYYPEVENVLENFKKIHFPDKHFGHGTIRKSFINLPNIDYSKFEIEIKDENSFNDVAREIKQIIEIGALSFFEKFNNLDTVFEESEKMVREELRNFIVQPLPQRRMVIKKLCNDSNYQDYTTRLIDYYKSENDDDWQEIELLDTFLKALV